MLTCNSENVEFIYTKYTILDTHTMCTEKNGLASKLVVCKAPLRISLAGGGTDIHSYCSKFGGEVIGFAINRFVITSIYTQSLDGKSRFLCDGQFSINSSDSNYTDVVLEKYNFNPSGIYLNTISDVPAGVGLGGSGAYLNSLLSALDMIHSVPLNPCQIADRSSDIEIVDLKRNVGRQDHYISALGGMNLLKFDSDMKTTVKNLVVGDRCKQYFEENLLLFYTGISRSASDILNSSGVKGESCKGNTFEKLHDIRSLVEPMSECIIRDSPTNIGEILHEHWEIKSSIANRISNKLLNKSVSDLMSLGADGCKLVGAGGGGFLLVSSKDRKQSDIRNYMDKLGFKELTFCYEKSGLITKAI